ncbi:MAG: HAMP domain-containing protein [Chloroflexi bacterium]|nr:HAMP domain-containing protein [Chloroflexota bacterium]
MRTLAFKLTLAFLFVGALGAVLVALFVAQRTQAGFNQFLSDSFQASLAASLVDYYQENGSWEGASQRLLQVDRPEMRPQERFLPWALVDADGRIVFGDRRYQPGQQLDSRTLDSGTPLIVDGQTVGRLVQLPIDTSQARPWSPEANFLANVNEAIFFSLLAAIIVALLVGVLLARNIARPLRDLTQATTAVAQGNLGLQVDVRGNDEIAELTTSFNQMSHDLALASRQRRQMTADIAHELRTPLSIILGYTESLRDGVLPPDADTFDILHDEALHLSRLVQDLRILSLADAGELSLSLEPVTPLELLKVVAAKYAHQAEQQGVILRVANPGTELPPCQMDSGRMEQVLGNLVSNALRYTSPKGEITLAANQITPETMTLFVVDDGQGIPAADLPRIFDRFYKADASRTENGESGLGLAIARSLVTMHGGTITVESVLGSGTTFRIELPIKKDPKGFQNP